MFLHACTLVYPPPLCCLHTLGGRPIHFVYVCRQDSTLEGRSTFSISVLVGRRDEPLLLIAARQLVEIAAAGSTKM
jgi:Proteasome assembly chaperone 3